MILSFCRYFFKYLLFKRTRQKLLYLAVGGLMIAAPSNTAGTGEPDRHPV